MDWKRTNEGGYTQHTAGPYLIQQVESTEEARARTRGAPKTYHLLKDGVLVGKCDKLTQVKKLALWDSLRVFRESCRFRA